MGRARREQYRSALRLSARERHGQGDRASLSTPLLFLFVVVVGWFGLG